MAANQSKVRDSKYEKWMAFLEHVCLLALMPSVCVLVHAWAKSRCGVYDTNLYFECDFMHNILPQHTDGDQLKHGYALCWNMIEHILLYSPACNSLFNIFHVIQDRISITIKISCTKTYKMIFLPPKSIQTDSHKHLGLLFCIIRQISFDNLWSLV